MADDQKKPPFDPNYGSWKSKGEAKSCTKKYRENKVVFEGLKGKKHAFLGEKKILRLLSQEGAIGIRTYMGLDDAGDPHLFLVAVDSNGYDILKAEKATEEQSEGLILNDGAWCPPLCKPPQDIG